MNYTRGVLKKKEAQEPCFIFPSYLNYNYDVQFKKSNKFSVFLLLNPNGNCHRFFFASKSLKEKHNIDAFYKHRIWGSYSLIRIKPSIKEDLGENILCILSYKKNWLCKDSNIFINETTLFINSKENLNIKDKKKFIFNKKSLFFKQNGFKLNSWSFQKEELNRKYLKRWTNQRIKKENNELIKKLDSLSLKTKELNYNYGIFC